ncbi:restriction endonuclease subunit S [Streptomyces silvisoli]|uniref:Restriction endonuclease subunit S n=1 Tax=Streptomyces silvisoli TaxID=3034235 RepID=A0ABT5ZU34_9ACTN|nr:hypothetical protein [Streptomyces silvisoli]MDF3293332.1 hypothetical protein [Streptomyces silvisoli]
MRDLYRPLDELVVQSRQVVSASKNGDLPYVGLEHLEPGCSTLTEMGSPEDSVSANGVFRPGDVLFGKLRPNLRKCVLSDRDGYCSTDIMVLRAREGIEPAYAGWVLRSERVVAEAVRTAEGTKMPRTSWSRLKCLRVFAPPMPEQRRIVEVLDAVAETERSIEASMQKLRTLRAGVLEELSAFEVTELGQVLASGPKNGLYKPGSAYGAEGTPIVRINSFEGGPSDLTRGLLRIAATGREIRQYGIQSGDILINRVNTPELVGKSTAVARLNEPTVFESNVMRCTLNPERALPGFTEAWLGTATVKAHFLRRAKSAVSQASINRSDVLSCPFPVADVAEQREFLRRLDAVDSQCSAGAEELLKLRKLKRGLADDLLTARVRINGFA